MNRSEIYAALERRGIYKGGRDREAFDTACDELLPADLPLAEWAERRHAIMEYVFGEACFRYTASEVEALLPTLGVNRFAKDLGGVKAFLGVAGFLNRFIPGSEEFTFYRRTIERYLDRPVTKEEQEQYERGEFRYDDV